MIGFLIRLAINAAALLVIANVSGGAITVRGWTAAFISALVLGLANALIKPILSFIANVLTLPLSCLTLGLWTLFLSWLINAALFFWVAAILEGFGVANFWAAMLGSLALSIVNAVTAGLFKEDKNRQSR